MKIIIDTREQRELVFKCETINKCLRVGDYCSIFSDGHEYPIVFERKSCGDLFGTLSAGYSRFKKEIERAKDNNIRLIIAIEGSKERILKGYPHSKRNGASILIQLQTIKERYGIEYMFFKSRIAMAHYITEFYQSHEQEYLNNLHPDIKI